MMRRYAVPVPGWWVALTAVPLPPGINVEFTELPPERERYGIFLGRSQVVQVRKTPQPCPCPPRTIRFPEIRTNRSSAKNPRKLPG